MREGISRLPTQLRTAKGAGQDADDFIGYSTQRDERSANRRQLSNSAKLVDNR